MPLALVVADAGHTGLALRRHRGAHTLQGTGQCKRLRLLLPAHVKGTEHHAEVPHRVALWLGSALVGLHDDAKAEFLFARMVGHERLGVALDKTLERVKDDTPRTASVLRAELKAIASTLRTEGVVEMLVAAADMYDDTTCRARAQPS